jgi:ankyrin repeat protein
MHCGSSHIVTSTSTSTSTSTATHTHTHRANVARKDNAHWTPLHYAAINAQTKCAALLIEKGTRAHESG